MTTDPPPTSEVQEFDELLDRVRQGSDDAAWELVERYGDHVLRAVRRRLPQWMRPKFDSLDFTQIVWASIFSDSDRLLDLRQPDELVRMLVTIANNKVVEEVRRRAGKKFAAQREQPLFDDDDRLGEAIHSADNSPSTVAILREHWESIAATRSPLHRQIIELRQQGHSYDEIAARLDINRRTAIRVVQKMLDDLQS